MKAFLISLTVITFGLSIYFTASRFERTGVSTMRIFDGQNDQRLSVKGKVMFNQTETLVDSISPNGYLHYENNNTELRVSKKEGKIVYRLKQDGEPVSINSTEGKVLLAETIRTIIQTGFDVHGRAERIYQQGGAKAVLTAAEEMQSDHVKIEYFQYLLKKKELQHDELLAILTRLKSIESDHEKSRLLPLFRDQRKDSVLANAYLDVIGSMEGDFQKRESLQHMIKRESNLLFENKIVDITGEFENDFEKASVISALLHRTEGNTPVEAILQVIHDMDNSFEKAQLLRKLMDKQDLVTQQWMLALKEVSMLEGDFEKANLMVSTVAKMPVTPQIDSAYRAAARTIGSEMEYGRTLKAIDQRTIR